MGARDKLNTFYFWIAGAVGFLFLLATDSFFVFVLIAGGAVAAFSLMGGIRWEPEHRPKGRNARQRPRRSRKR